MPFEIAQGAAHEARLLAAPSLFTSAVLVESSDGCEQSAGAGMYLSS
jgi:hypothetical protein